MSEPALDWARVTTLAEHALTLDESSFDEMLTTLGEEQAAEVQRLLRRMPPRGFMATSADDDGDPSWTECVAPPPVSADFGATAECGFSA